ncbi:MAG: carboxypeptidase-like regulatory domain-containing protein, partial [Gammaproteobacteria bacterium]|nr:carboxypeptidase-like regulatory domain-containing protein [Gammaproteobacteria bacterium]
MAELCMAGIEGERYRCRSGRYDELQVAVDTREDATAPSGHSISGRVMTAEGVALDGVMIVATPERLRGERIANVGTLRFWTVTNSLGAYALSGLPEGEYMIRSGAHGSYQSARYTARTGVDYADLVVRRDAAAVVEGLVLTAKGEPLEGVTVLPILLGQPSALTGDDGRFRIRVNLKPAVESFALRFQRPGFLEQSNEVQLGNFANTADAMVKVIMHPVESWTSLSGIVYSDSGEPLPGRKVELRPIAAKRTYTATTDHDGKYTFPIVEAPDEYRLMVLGGGDHKDYRQALNLTADMTEFDVVVESYEFGALTGQLVNPNGVPVPDFDLVLRNVASRHPNAMVSTDALGNFEIDTAPAGRLVVASQSTPSMLVQGLQLRPGDKLHLPLVLDLGEHEIRGVVVD